EYFLIIGIIFGAIMSIALGTLQITFVKRLPYQNYVDPLNVRQMRTVDIQLSFNDNMTKIIIKSSPLLSTTMVDYGKDIKNIEKIVKFLEKKQKT
ncbi:hypothetical protein J7L48_09630, partial [bacterium]|nr:hypothetical protein [bacterium]